MTVYLEKSVITWLIENNLLMYYIHTCITNTYHNVYSNAIILSKTGNKD